MPKNPIEMAKEELGPMWSDWVKHHAEKFLQDHGLDQSHLDAVEGGLLYMMQIAFRRPDDPQKEATKLLREAGLIQ